MKIVDRFNANITKIYLFSFLRSLHFMGGIMIPFFMDWGGISFTQIMLLQTFFMISVFVMEVPTGAIADRFGRKTSLILAAIITGIGALVYSSFPSIWVFVLGEFIWAIGSALLSGADEALLYDSLKKAKRMKDSKTVMARMHSFGMAGIMIGAPIGSIIAATFSLQYAFMIIVIPMALAAIVGLTLEEPKANSSQKPNYWKTLTSGINCFRKHRALKMLAIDEVVIGVLAFFVIWTYQLVLKELSIAIIWFGFIAAAISLWQIMFHNSFPWLEKVFGGKRAYLKYSALIPGIGFILLGLNADKYIGVLLIVIIAAFGLSRRALFSNYFNKHIKSHNRATVLSTIRMGRSAFLVCLYPLVGIAVEFSLPLALAGIGILLMAMAFLSPVKEEMLLD